MKPVERNEILDYVTYEENREQIRSEALEAKKTRRIHLGDYLTFLFENQVTVRYQVLEMVRTERLVKESDIAHELKTYNELLGDDGGLGCTLLIEITDEVKRPELLIKWHSLPKHLYLVLEDGSKTYASFDERQIGETRLSSVQFLKFDCKGQTPVKIGSDHPELSEETELSSETQKSLKDDLQ